MVSDVVVASFQVGQGCRVAQCSPQPAPALSPGKGAVGGRANDSASLLSVLSHLLPYGLHIFPLFSGRVHAGRYNSSLVPIQRWDTKLQPLCVSSWHEAACLRRRVGHCSSKRKDQRAQESRCFQFIITVLILDATGGPWVHAGYHNWHPC